MFRAFFDLGNALLVAGGVSALSFPFCSEAASPLEGETDGDGGGESTDMVSLVCKGCGTCWRAHHLRVCARTVHFVCLQPQHEPLLAAPLLYRGPHVLWCSLLLYHVATACSWMWYALCRRLCREGTRCAETPRRLIRYVAVLEPALAWRRVSSGF